MAGLVSIRCRYNRRVPALSIHRLPGALILLIIPMESQWPRIMG